MSAAVKWIWIVILAVLFFGYYAAAVFLLEMAFVGLIYWKKPHWFKDGREKP